MALSDSASSSIKKKSVNTQCLWWWGRVLLTISVKPCYLINKLKKNFDTNSSPRHLNIALLNFLLDSLIWKVRVKRWTNHASLMKFCLKNAETVPKTHHNRSRKIIIWGTMTLHPPRIFSHSELHLSLDSYDIGWQN